MPFHFDNTITFGNIAEILVIVITVTTAYTRLVERLTSLEIKVDAMWDSFIARQRGSDIKTLYK